MTPEERAAAELAEELGFEVVDYSRDGYGFRVHRFKTAVSPESWYYATTDAQVLWSLAVRQRVELNKLNGKQ